MIASRLCLHLTGRGTLTGQFTHPIGLDTEDGERQATTSARLIVALNERVGEVAFLDMLIFNPSES
ncbi:MAG: hypothetical protein ACRDNS_19260 [Trebonia sp.]